MKRLNFRGHQSNTSNKTPPSEIGDRSLDVVDENIKTVVSDLASNLTGQIGNKLDKSGTF